MSRPKHARRSRRPAVLATAGVSAAAAVSASIILSGQGPPAEAKITLAPPLNDAHVLQVALARMPAVAHDAGPVTYLIRPGDTLYGIAREKCGNPDDFRALAVNNGIRYADRINAGAVLRIACRAAAEALARVRLEPPARPVAGGDPPAVTADVQPAGPAVTVSGGTLGCAGLEGLWDAAGGNPQHAFMAAEIAEAESGGQQYAHSPTDDFGYWQINASNGSLATYDALGNARSAIILSDDGTNWSPWTTYTEGLYAGRC